MVWMMQLYGSSCTLMSTYSYAWSQENWLTCDNYKTIMWWLTSLEEFKGSDGVHVGSVGVISGMNMVTLDSKVHKLMDKAKSTSTV